MCRQLPTHVHVSAALLLAGAYPFAISFAHANTILIPKYPVSVHANKASAQKLSLPAQKSQTSTPFPQQPSAEEKILVIGQRAADKRSISAKRHDSRIVDVISADDVGKMSDFNAGEALRRIAGVNVWTYLGEPRFVTIRGFNTSYNTTTLDGFQMASPDNANYGSGRQFYMDALPSAVASKISVYKTYSSDMEGHFLGGAIDFTAPDALDSNKNRTRISLTGGANVTKSSYGNVKPTASAEVSTLQRFGAERQFGFSLSGSYWRRDMNITDSEIGGDAYSYGPTKKSNGLAVVASPYGGKYGPYPSGGTYYNYDDSRERKAAVTKFSWRQPNGKASVTLDGYYLQQDEHFLRNEWTADTAQGGSNFDAVDPTATSLRVDDTASQYQLLNSRFRRQIWGTNTTFKYNFTNKLKATLGAGYSGAAFNNTQTFNRFVLPAANGNYYQVSQSGDVWSWNPVGTSFQKKFSDLSNYNTGNGGGQSGASAGRNLTEHFTTHAQVVEVQGRLDYNMGSHDYGFGIGVGGKYSENKRRDDYTRIDYGSTGNGISLADVASGDYLSSLGCNSCIVAIDPKKVAAAMKTLTAKLNSSSPGNRFSTQEDIAAGWLTGRWRAQRWELDAGFRLEATNYNTTGFQAVTSASGSASYQQVSAQDHFINPLPSLTFIYNTASNMRSRFAYSRTIGRPSLTQKSLRGGVLDLTQDPPTLTQGNPDLKPLVSDNFDVIHEIYFDHGTGMFSLGGFFKKIDNEIYITQSVKELSGVQYYATMPVNSPYTTIVGGAEFNFIKNFTFLPGFLKNTGIQANGFIAATRFPISLSNGQKYNLNILPDQARYATNLSLFYEDPHGFSARISWNRTGPQWDGRVSGSTNLPGADKPTAATLYKRLFLIPVDTLSFKASYSFRNKYTVSISGNNLLHKGASGNIGNSQEISARRLYVPSSFMLGLSADL